MNRSNHSARQCGPRWLCLVSCAAALVGCRQQLSIPEETERVSNQPLSSPGKFKFREVATQAGVGFIHTDGAAGDLNVPETMGSGCAFLDFDNDGWLDLFFVNCRPLRGDHVKRPTCRLYRNNRDGTFTDVTAGSGLEETFFGMGCAIGDYDNDGKVDLYVTSTLDGSRLFHNLGGGKFEEVAKPAGVRNDDHWGTSAAWVDYDRDGKLDLFVCNYVKYHWGDDKYCTTPETHRTYCNPRSFAAETCRLFRNLGNGRFEEVSETAGIASATAKALGVLVFDYDDDGWPDLMVTSDTTANLLFHNEGGKFKEVGITAGVAFSEDGRARAGMGIDAAHTWNDGRIAILVSNFANEGLSLFTQKEEGSAFLDNAAPAGVYSPSRMHVGFGLAFFDVDNDGLKDAIVVNGHIDPWIGEHTALTYAEPHLLFRNSGNGKFTEVGRSAGEVFRKSWVSRGLAVGDYDNDGRLDVLISNNGGPAELLHNETPTRGLWLQLELEGTRSNRSGFGARARLSSPGMDRYDWLRSGSSYCSQNMPRIHFALPARQSSAVLEVTWPSGKNDKVEVRKFNQRLRIREGKGVVN